MDVDIILRLTLAGLMIGSVYALVGLGFSLLYHGTGLINFAQGEFVMIGAFAGWTTVELLGLPFWVGLLGAAVVPFVIAFAVHRTFVSWITTRGGRLVDVLLASIGLSIVLQNLARLLWGTEVLKVTNPLPGTVRFGAAIVPAQSVAIVVVSVITVVVLYVFLQRTAFGTAMRAAADNRYAASVIGINTKLVNGVTWGIAGAVAGIAGLMIAPLFGAYFFMGLTVGLKGFAAAVVGGFGNLWGAVAGGMIIGLAETFGAFFISSQWKDALTMVVLILFLLVRPQGLFRAAILND